MTWKFPSLQPEADVRCSIVVMVSRANITGGRLWRCTMSGAGKAIGTVVGSVNGRAIMIDKMDGYLDSTRLIMVYDGEVTRFV